MGCAIGVLAVLASLGHSLGQLGTRIAFAPRTANIELAATIIVAAVAVAAAQAPETMLSGQIDVARLVDLAAQRLHLNIEYDAAALKTPVTLRIGAGLSDQEFLTLLNRVLAARGAHDSAIAGASRLQRGQAGGRTGAGSIGGARWSPLRASRRRGSGQW